APSLAGVRRRRLAEPRRSAAQRARRKSLDHVAVVPDAAGKRSAAHRGRAERSVRLMPRVSFVVPCYRLGHLLADCVNSILSQTFQDFGVLIMGDCSPDGTPQVDASFSEPPRRPLR